MQAFTQYTPTEIVFGKGAELRLADMIRKHGGTRVMLVYGGGSVIKSGLLPRLEGLLREEKIECVAFGGVQPNPLLSRAREGVEKARAFHADMIIGVGGGSAIDTAKAVAHGAANPGADIWDFWVRKRELTKSLPVGAVLTISAAGSETSNSAVITNKETGEKRGLGTDFNRPAFALMNPELTYTLPEYQIACGVVDIMMHTLDRYFTKTEGNGFTAEVAEALLRVVIENGSKAMENPRDYDAMSELMWCGSVSHNGMTGLGNAVDFSVHQLGHELSAMFDIAHGASLSVMWGAWAEYVLEERPECFARYAEKVWGVKNGGDIMETARTGIEKTVGYFKSLQMPVCFSEAREIGAQPDSVAEELALRCSFRETRLVGQFKRLDKKDLIEIYRKANRFNA
ncbi:MAG: iron-containing alcohol dehydrogenase [Clostridiales bacterium]|jgi:alcohol dehydrogenase YqhD (iron-dependent ADH family)|nr:iron-containing alcohol dehydrogenase [Clostridiales bacterium]